MIWVQRRITLAPRPRGFHLITRELVEALPELDGFEVGLLHLLIQHTSASLALNENASPDVRHDFETWFNQAVPERAPYWTHTLEGDEDMPAHVKAALLGPSLTLPVSQGRLALGTWQGVYLCEHRNRGGSRHVVATAWGETGSSARRLRLRSAPLPDRGPLLGERRRALARVLGAHHGRDDLLLAVEEFRVGPVNGLLQNPLARARARAARSRRSGRRVRVPPRARPRARSGG